MARAYAFACDASDRRDFASLPEAPGFDHAAAVLCRIGSHCSWREALASLQTLRRCEAGAGAAAHRAVLAACARDGQWQQGLELLEEMARAGFPPTAADYACVMAAALQLGHWDRVLDLFRQLQEAGPAPDRAVRLLALDACAAGAAWERALALLEELRPEEAPTSLRLHRPAAAALLAAGEHRRALALLEEMECGGPRPDNALLCSVYAAAAAAALQSGEQEACEEALDLLERLSPPQLSVQVMLHERELRIRLPHRPPRVPPPPVEVEYKISVRTSDVEHAGTDANVFVVLYGDGVDTGPVFLKGSESWEDAFERNKVDDFTVTARLLGEVTRLRLGHDNQGIGADWHCERVSVEQPLHGKVWNFMINEWFSSRRGDNLVEREFEVDNTDVQRQEFVMAGRPAPTLVPAATEHVVQEFREVAKRSKELCTMPSPERRVAATEAAVAGPADAELEAEAPEQEEAEEEDADDDDDAEPAVREPVIKKSSMVVYDRLMEQV